VAHGNESQQQPAAAATTSRALSDTKSSGCQVAPQQDACLCREFNKASLLARKALEEEVKEKWET
jgi:hypothetical protein